jgi:hypothetical protein
MKNMDTKTIIVGTSLMVAGGLAALGGTMEIFTRPLPLVGMNFMQIGGAVVMLLGVATFTNIDPLGLRRTAPVLNV